MTRSPLLQKIPKVDVLISLCQEDPLMKSVPSYVITAQIQATLEGYRSQILQGETFLEEDLHPTTLVSEITARVEKALSPNLCRVINATGVVVHTNLGRSLLPLVAVESLVNIAGVYSNLELDLSTGKRGSRYAVVEDILCELTGAEAALVVNNNAAAVLLCLETIAKGKEVIASRGELVEIGGSFRIPDVMARSGGVLKEVGATNRTHLKDYIAAITDETALLLKVHKSNYSIVGFTKEVTLSEMVALGKEKNLPVMEDLGSGNFIDFAKYGLMAEATVQMSVAAGADIVTFSGDKLLGGPQAGIIVGKKQYIDQIKRNPMNRALRIDKLTLAALERVLRIYRDPDQAVKEIPTLRMMMMSLKEIQNSGKSLIRNLKKLGNDRLLISTHKSTSRAGGGALPLMELPTECVAIQIQNVSANQLETFLRESETPIIGRIENDWILLDPRTLSNEDKQIIVATVDQILEITKEQVFK